MLFTCRTILIFITTIAFFLASTLVAPAAQQARPGVVSGKITDELGATVPAARVVLVDGAGVERDATSDTDGRFVIRGVAPGVYTLRVEAEGFSEFVKESFAVVSGANQPLDVTLSVAAVDEQVDVNADNGISTSSDSNADAIVLKERDIAALPDDPDELAAALQEMAGPGAGPGGPQFVVDGFQGGRLPPKESIREIRINSNPFSAEYDRIGFGRIEILTKPGSDRFRGTAFFSFNDESLNARNAFAPTRAAQQERRYGGNVSGPVGKRASFFLDFERRETDEFSTVAATVLDQNLNPLFFTTTLPQPARRTTFSPRFDLQAGEKHTLTFRYGFTEQTSDGNGVGAFALPTRSTSSESRDHELSIGDTFIVNPGLVSETRIQLRRRRSTSMADVDAGSALIVADSFLDRSSAGRTERGEDRLEIQQNFLFSRGNHSFKAGVRVRGVKLTEFSTSNYVGTFTFAGDVERDPATGAPRPGNDVISSLEQYRRTLLGLPGYGPSQFTLSAGEPYASVNQWEMGVYFQDEWRVRQNFTFSYGLRYENQTNAGGEHSFAPRIGLAYSFNSADGRPKAVLRAGVGIFYDDVDEDLTLDQTRFDGIRQQQFIVPRPSFFPNVPTPTELGQFFIPTSRRQLNAFETPYAVQGSVSLERQLPWNVTGTVTYFFSRGVHQLRTRNINAPDPATRVRPLGDALGNVFSVEASGLSWRNQIRFGFNRRAAGWLSFFGNYGLNWSRSDTDGSGSQPVNPYDLRSEYGRASDDSRQFLFVGTNISAPWGVTVNPFLIARSGRPYNITTGRDLNGDSVFTDRPSYASPDDVDAVATPFGLLDPTPDPGDILVPRNLATGPSFVRLNVSIGKSFSFGSKREGAFDPSALNQRIPGSVGGGGGRPRGGGGGSRGGGPPGGGFGGGGGGNDQRFSLALNVNVQNILNQVNYAAPSGSLTSPQFGQPNVALPGRRVDVSLRFSF